MRKYELTRQLLGAFKLCGYDGVSINDLSRSSGLAKPSLYHYFPNGKPDMAKAVLALEGARLQTLVLSPLTAKTGPATALRESLDGVRAYYEGPVPVCLMNVFMTGSFADRARDPIDRTVERWTELMAVRFEGLGLIGRDARNRSEEVIQHIQGALVLGRVKESRLPLEACLDILIATLVDHEGR